MHKGPFCRLPPLPVANRVGADRFPACGILVQRQTLPSCGVVSRFTPPSPQTDDDPSILSHLAIRLRRHLCLAVKVGERTASAGGRRGGQEGWRGLRNRNRENEVHPSTPCPSSRRQKKTRHLHLACQPDSHIAGRRRQPHSHTPRVLDVHLNIAMNRNLSRLHMQCERGPGREPPSTTHIVGKPTASSRRRRRRDASCTHSFRPRHMLPRLLACLPSLQQQASCNQLLLHIK